MKKVYAVHIFGSDFNDFRGIKLYLKKENAELKVKYLESEYTFKGDSLGKIHEWKDKDGLISRDAEENSELGQLDIESMQEYFS